MKAPENDENGRRIKKQEEKLASSNICLFSIHSQFRDVRDMNGMDF